MSNVLVDHPPIIVYRDDIERLRCFGMAHGLGDSAIALRRLFDEEAKLRGAAVVVSEQVRAIEALPWWRWRQRRLHWLAIRDTLTIALDEGMVTRGSRVG